MTPSTGIISNYLEYYILNYILRGIDYTLPETIFLNLYSTNAGESDTGTEIIDADTPRPPIVRSLDLENNNNIISNKNEISFSQALHNWGTVVGWGLKSSEAGGNLLFYGLLDTPVYISTGQTFKIGAGNMEISFLNSNTTDGGFTSVGVSAAIDWIINSTPFSYTRNGSQLALGRNISLDSNNRFVSWTECSGTGYVRKILSTSAWSIPSSDNISSNNSEQVFTTYSPDNTWGVISHIVLYDNETGAQPIFWGCLPTPITIQTGDGFKIPVNGINIQFL